MKHFYEKTGGKGMREERQYLQGSLCLLVHVISRIGGIQYVSKCTGRIE
jgi:hypothetical protein